MNGHNINSAISVDCFKEPANSRLHFLTHMHSDHTVGLSSTWSHVIYCSEVTSKLLSHKFSISSKYIQVLDWDHLYCLKSQGDTICVKMLPANHCPGACMFLFESKTDRILYTGDFRFNEEIGKALQKVISPHNPIDVLYLDNTYCEPSCDFPTQDEAVQMIIKICQHHPKHRIIIGMSFIGHEELLCKVAQAIHEYVYVEESIFERVKMIDGVYGEIFKPGRSTRLNAVPNHLIKASVISKWNEEVKTIVIKPTARLGNVTSIGGDLCTSGLTYTVPYSNHSNFKELTEFVRQVHPRAIIPIVPGRKPFSGMESVYRADMTQFSHLLAEAKPETTSLPSPLCKDFGSDADEIRDIVLKQKLVRKKRKLKLNQESAKRPRGVVFKDEQNEQNPDDQSSKTALATELCSKQIEIPENNSKEKQVETGSDEKLFELHENSNQEIIRKTVLNLFQTEITQPDDELEDNDAKMKLPNTEMEVTEKKISCIIETDIKGNNLDFPNTDVHLQNKDQSEVLPFFEKDCSKLLNGQLPLPKKSNLKFLYYVGPSVQTKGAALKQMVTVKIRKPRTNRDQGERFNLALNDQQTLDNKSITSGTPTDCLSKETQKNKEIIANEQVESEPDFNVLGEKEDCKSNVVLTDDQPLTTVNQPDSELEPPIIENIRSNKKLEIADEATTVHDIEKDLPDKEMSLHDKSMAVSEGLDSSGTVLSKQDHKELTESFDGNSSSNLSIGQPEQRVKINDSSSLQTPYSTEQNNNESFDTAIAADRLNNSSEKCNNSNVINTRPSETLKFHKSKSLQCIFEDAESRSLIQMSEAQEIKHKDIGTNDGNSGLLDAQPREISRIHDSRYSHTTSCRRNRPNENVTQTLKPKSKKLKKSFRKNERKLKAENHKCRRKKLLKRFAEIENEIVENFDSLFCSS